MLFFFVILPAPPLPVKNFKTHKQQVVVLIIVANRIPVAFGINAPVLSTAVTVITTATCVAVNAATKSKLKPLKQHKNPIIILIAVPLPRGQESPLIKPIKL